MPFKGQTAIGRGRCLTFYRDSIILSMNKSYQGNKYEKESKIHHKHAAGGFYGY